MMTKDEVLTFIKTKMEDESGEIQAIQIDERPEGFEIEIKSDSNPFLLADNDIFHGYDSISVPTAETGEETLYMMVFHERDEDIIIGYISRENRVEVGFGDVPAEWEITMWISPPSTKEWVIKSFERKRDEVLSGEVLKEIGNVAFVLEKIDTFSREHRESTLEKIQTILRRIA